MRLPPAWWPTGGQLAMTERDAAFTPSPASPETPVRAANAIPALRNSRSATAARRQSPRGVEAVPGIRGRNEHQPRIEAARRAPSQHVTVGVHDVGAPLRRFRLGPTHRPASVSSLAPMSVCGSSQKAPLSRQHSMRRKLPSRRAAAEVLQTALRSHRPGTRRQARHRRESVRGCLGETKIREAVVRLAAALRVGDVGRVERQQRDGVCQVRCGKTRRRESALPWWSQPVDATPILNGRDRECVLMSEKCRRGLTAPEKPQLWHRWQPGILKAD